MVQAVIWPVIWLLVRKALNVSKAYVDAAIAAVKEAETLDLPGPQKRQHVFKKLQEVYSEDDWAEAGRRITNTILELAVSYVKQRIG